MSVAQRELQALYVTWQDQATKRYYPIGRLVSGLGPERPEYEFCYLQGVSEARRAGFELLLSFTDLKSVYRSNELFPFFQNRLMSPGRADYREFVSSLAIDPEHAEPMTVLMRSGGGRATDSLEMFEVPKVSGEGHPYQTHFLAHGIRYLHPSALDRIAALRVNERLPIMFDCQNEADASALALRTEDRVIVGYMPRYLLGDAIELLQTCPTVEVYVERVSGSAPLQQRLLCRLDSCWPPDFRPFCEPQYRPLSPDATDLSSWCRRDPYISP